MQEDAELAALYASIEAAARQYQAAKAARAMVMAMAGRGNGSEAGTAAAWAAAAASSQASAGRQAASYVDNPHPPRARSLGPHSKHTGAVTGPGRLSSVSAHGGDSRRSLDVTAAGASGRASPAGRSTARSSGSFRNPFAAEGSYGTWSPAGERTPAAGGSPRGSAGSAGVSRRSESAGSARSAGLPPQSGSSTPFRRCWAEMRGLCHDASHSLCLHDMFLSFGTSARKCCLHGASRDLGHPADADWPDNMATLV